MPKTVANGIAVAMVLIALPALALQSPTPAAPQNSAAEPVEPQPLEQVSDPKPESGPVRRQPLEQTSEPRPERPPAKITSPDTITPSERIEADSAVSFPVDI